MFKNIKEILFAASPAEKIGLFKAFYCGYKNGEYEIDDEPVILFEKPSFAPFCNIVAPRDVPRRKFSTKEGRAVMIHAIAHIEYSAIDLALDHAYRFRGLPKEYYNDWLEVADEEVKHFLMLNALLEELGSKYGDYPVHDALFEAMQKTTTLLERMAVVPRFLEANGLDSNTFLVEKISQFKDPFALKLLDALAIILRDEIEHVRKGDRWFRYACEGKPLEVYFEIIKKHYPNSIERNKPVNENARLKAGFEPCEIEFFKGAKEP